LSFLLPPPGLVLSLVFITSIQKSFKKGLICVSSVPFCTIHRYSKRGLHDGCHERSLSFRKTWFYSHDRKFLLSDLLLRYLCYYVTVLSSFMTYHRVCNKSNTMVPLVQLELPTFLQQLSTLPAFKICSYYSIVSFLSSVL